MPSLAVTIIALIGVVQLDNLQVSGTEFELTVEPGDNVTLYCDCMWDYGLKIYWYKNCLQCRNPSLAISTQDITLEDDNSFPHYQAKVNTTSQSHDLLIKNITESELGVYYCCVVEPLQIDRNDIMQKYFHRFGKITYKLSFDGVAPSPPPSCPPPPPPPDDGGAGQHWMLLVILCSLCALLSASISLTCVLCLHNKTATEDYGQHLKGRKKQRSKQDEDNNVCYASLNVPTAAKTTKPMKGRTPTQNSNFSTYSEVRTHITHEL